MGGKKTIFEREGGVCVCVGGGRVDARPRLRVEGRDGWVGVTSLS